MVTLGTGVGPDIYWNDLKLLPSHCYAVIGVCPAFPVMGSAHMYRWKMYKKLELFDR